MICKPDFTFLLLHRLKKIPAICLTLCQQGGIGYPPVLVKLDRWYAVEDSRGRKPPNDLDLWWQRMWPRRDPHWHTQLWVLRAWQRAPRLTWDEVMQRATAANGETRPQEE